MVATTTGAQLLFQVIRYSGDVGGSWDPADPALSEGAVLCTGTLAECREAVEEVIRAHQQEALVCWSDQVPQAILSAMQAAVEDGSAPESAAAALADESVRLRPGEAGVWLRPSEAEALVARARSLPEWREGLMEVRCDYPRTAQDLRWEGFPGDWEAYHEGSWEGCGGWSIARVPGQEVWCCPTCRGVEARGRRATRFDSETGTWQVYRGGWVPCPVCGGVGEVCHPL